MILAAAEIASGNALVALIALTVMEIVLGIDNIVFIAIITGRLPDHQRPLARRLGLALAMGMRIALLLVIGWLMHLDNPLPLDLSDLSPIAALDHYLEQHPEVNEVSPRDLILLFGGLFLLYTAVREIHHKVEGGEEDSEWENLPGDVGQASEGVGPPQRSAKPSVSFGGVLFRIAFMDVIFSLDSVITAVGMADQIAVMVAAIVISVGVMIRFADQISDFVQMHPTVKMLALSFLILIGVVLVSEGVGTPISKGYVYFAMAFSLSVEFLNLRAGAYRDRPGAGEGETGAIRVTPSGDSTR